MEAQRRNEIGLRMALGADRGSVIGLVMREAGFLLMIGLIAGTALALWTRLPPPLCYSASDRTTPRRLSPRARCWPALAWWQTTRRQAPHPASIRCKPRCEWPDGFGGQSGGTLPARSPVDALGIVLAAFGMLGPLLAAFIHVTSELTFILNSARLLPRSRPQTASKVLSEVRS
jgi:ABC-type antimicrobial peptide transport system permease subunit